jgi:hypothetical protein
MTLFSLFSHSIGTTLCDEHKEVKDANISFNCGYRTFNESPGSFSWQGSSDWLVAGYRGSKRRVRHFAMALRIRSMINSVSGINVSMPKNIQPKSLCTWGRTVDKDVLSKEHGPLTLLRWRFLQTKAGSRFHVERTRSVFRYRILLKEEKSGYDSTTIELVEMNYYFRQHCNYNMHVTSSHSSSWTVKTFWPTPSRRRDCSS